MSFNPTDFPRESEQERMNLLGNYRNLYQNDHKDILPLHDKIQKHFESKKSMIYLAHAIPSLITDNYADFVQGDAEEFRVENTNDTSDTFVSDIVANNNLKEEVYNIASVQSQFGYSVLQTYIDNNSDVRIKRVPSNQFFPQDDGSVVIATWKKTNANDDVPNSAKYLVLMEHYTLENGAVRIERQIGRTDQTNKIDELLDYDRFIGRFRGDKDEQQTLEIDEIPFVLINNLNATHGMFGESDYQKIMPQLNEINERASHASLQLLKNLDSRLVLPDIESVKDEQGQASGDVGDTLVVPEESRTPEYLSNENVLLEELREHIMYNLKIISAVSGVPMMQVLKGNMPDRVTALRTKHFRMERKTRSKQSSIAEGIRSAMRIASKLVPNREPIDPESITIDFGSVLPEDDTEQVKREQMKIRAGLTSKKSAIMRIENMDADQAEEELDQIRQENRVEGVTDTENPPQLGDNEN